MILLRPQPSRRLQAGHDGLAPCQPIRSDRIRRRGAVVLMALVCIAVAAVMFMALLRLFVMERGALRTEAWKAQAAWLVESGLERAAARLAADPEYQGETWQIPGDALGGDDSAVVRIEVRTVPEQSDRRLVHVRADYPDDPQHRARESKQLVIEVRPSSQEGPPATAPVGAKPETSQEPSGR